MPKEEKIRTFTQEMRAAYRSAGRKVGVPTTEVRVESGRYGTVQVVRPDAETIRHYMALQGVNVDQGSSTHEVEDSPAERFDTMRANLIQILDEAAWTIVMTHWTDSNLRSTFYERDVFNQKKYDTFMQSLAFLLEQLAGKSSLPLILPSSVLPSGLIKLGKVTYRPKDL